MKKRTLIEKARITALASVIFMVLALAACDSGTPAPTDIPPTAPESTPPTTSPTPVPPPLPASETVEIDLSGGGVTNERLAQMVANGEIPANVTNLSVWDNQISDLSPLSGLTNLTELNIAANQISNLSPISGLTNLTQLAMAGNPISDLTPLSGLTNLANLHMLEIQASDLTPLRGLTNLSVLYISGGEIRDIEPLRGLTNLTYLLIRTYLLDGLTPLHGLYNLTHLQLDITIMSQRELERLIAALPNCLVLYEYSVILPIYIIDELEPFEGNALVFLGMQRLDAWEALMAYMNQDDVLGGNEFYSSITDGYHRSSELNDFWFLTDENEELYSIAFFTPRYPAKSGMRVGDIAAHAVELYGTDYSDPAVYVNLGDYMFEYSLGSHYFAVYFRGGEISGWRVSRYNEQTFRDAFTDSVRPEN